MQKEGSAYLQMSNTLDLDIGPQGQLVHGNAGPTLRSRRNPHQKYSLPYKKNHTKQSRAEKEARVSARSPV